jgi:hypothetical protein
VEGRNRSALQLVGTIRSGHGAMSRKGAHAESGPTLFACCSDLCGVGRVFRVCSVCLFCRLGRVQCVQTQTEQVTVKLGRQGDRETLRNLVLAFVLQIFAGPQQK